MISDEDVERVAREYCKLRGGDPDSLHPEPPTMNKTGVMTLELRRVPLWRLAAEFVRQRAAMDEAFTVLRPAIGATTATPCA
jgi:hypothetical protein